MTTKAKLRSFKGMYLKEFLNADIPPIEYLVDKIIPKASLIYVYGPPASFKTNWLIFCSLKLIKGNNIFNFNVKKPKKVLWIDEENREIGMHDKLKKITKGMNFDINNTNSECAIFYSNNFNILNIADIKSLEHYIKEGQFDLVVIDSIAKVFPLSERDERDVRQIYSMLKPLMDNYNTSFVIIHHTRKLYQGQKSRNMEDISGSREFAAMADSMLYLQAVGNNKFMLKQTKNRYDKNIKSINFTVESGEKSLIIKFKGLAKENIEKVADKIKYKITDWLIKHPKASYKTITIIKAMKKEGWKDDSIRKAIKMLIDDKILVSSGYSEYRFFEDV